MITIECVGELKENIVIDHIKNIYKNDKMLGNFSEEFASVALSLLNDEINTGDKFKIRVLDKKGNEIKNGEFTFDFIEGGTLHYVDEEEE